MKAQRRFLAERTARRWACLVASVLLAGVASVACSLPGGGGLAGTGGSAPAAIAGQMDGPAEVPPDPGFEPFRRTDLIYGTEIGSWRYGRAYDAFPLLTNPTCQQLAQEARIPLVRWMPGSRFTDLGGELSEGEFNNIIDGLLSLEKIVLIKTPPGVDYQCTPQADLAWLKEIVRRAGERVTLYEFTNEPDYYCGWTADQYSREWVRVVPQLKKYARSLGFEIYVGGPAWSDFKARDLQTFLRNIKAEYDRTGDNDLIPSFVSFHAYSSHERDDSNAVILARVTATGEAITQLREESRRVFGYELRVAVSEWNFTTDLKDPRDTDRDFMRAYTQGMLKAFRQHGAWLANQFTFASLAGGGKLDMVDLYCQAKPQYDAFKEISAPADR